MWSMLGTQKGAAVGSAACSAASRHSAVHRPHVPRAGAERRLQARPGGAACGLSEEPSDLLRDSLQHSIRGWEDLRAAPRGGRCRTRAAVCRTSSRKRSAGAGCAAHVFRPVRPGLCQPAAARLLDFGEPGRRLGQPTGPRHRCRSAGPCRHACCCSDAACINPVRDLASCRLHGRRAA